MLELAGHGAKVLHAECVELARRAGVALYARATDNMGGGTRIDVETNLDLDRKVAGVAGQKGMVRLRATAPDAADRLLAAVSDHAIAVQCVDIVHHSIEMWFSLADVPDWDAIKPRLVASLPPGGDLGEDGGAVTMVGHGVGADPGLMLRARQVARQAGIATYAMSTSPLRVSLYCKDSEVDELVNLLHRAFCE
jgi:aspartate kinase